MKKKLKNIGKRILSFTLSGVLAAGLLPAAGGARAEQAEDFVLDNGYIRAEVSEDNGGFAIRTVEGSKVNKDDNNKNLLFHSDEDDTSFTSFQVIRNGEKKEYIFGGTYPGSSGVKTVKNNEEIKSEWSVDNLTFTQTISLVNSGSNEHGTVHIGYTAKNTGEAAEVKCRILLDTALGNQDYAYYNIGDGSQLTESETTLFAGGYQKSFYAVDNPKNPAVTAYTINASVDNKECAPYQTTFAHWNNLAATVFDYTPDSGMTFTNPNNKAYLTADSAYALYFDMGTLQKDTNADIATNYGIFSNETVDREDTAAVNVIGPDVMELTDDKTAYKNEGKFTVNTEIENIGETTYERVRVVVYTTGRITPLNENGVLQENIYYRDYTNFVPEQRQTMQWDFQALPGDEGVYSKIQYKVYDVSDDATLNTGKLLDENLMGEGKCYLLCPGSINEIPAIQFTGSSPDVLYTTGTRNLYITGSNFLMLENSGDYKLMLSRVDGRRFLGADSVEIPKEQIKIDSAKNSMTIVMNDDCPGELPEGQYQLTFDYTDSMTQDITAPALRFQVKREEKYRNDSYGVLAVEKTADKNYHIRTFTSNEEYENSINSKNVNKEDILLEFRGSFSKNTKAAAGSKVYQGISLNDSDNVMTLNNCLDIRKGMVTVTEKNGSVKVDFDASIYTTGAGTSVWSGVAALTELKSGEDYGLIPYKENGDRGDFSFETITLLWPGVGQAAQNLMGFLMDLKYGELGVITHENETETRVVAFGAAMDLSFVIPKISQQESNQSLLGDAYNAAIHSEGMDAETLRTINDSIPYNTETVNTSADSAQEEEEDDDKTISASVQIDDVLFGGKYLGVNLSIGLGIPGYVEGMPSLEGVLTIKTVGDWQIGVEGTCDFSVCCFEGEIYIKSKDGIPVPDTIKFFMGGVTPGINIDGMGVLWLQGGGGGIENLYDTIFLQDCIPPLKVILELQASLMQVISVRASLELSLRGFGIELTDGEVANAVPVLKRARLQFDWYPSFYFLGSVNISIYDAITGGGYIVAEEADEGAFFEFFVRAALQIPDNIPIIGGIKVAQAGLGANNQKLWGQVSVLGTNLGVVYYWGGSIDWGGGAEAVPTYPDLLGAVDAGSETALMSGDMPVYYDEETGRTLYAHVGTNLNGGVQTVSHIISVKSMDQNVLHTSIDAKTHTVSLAENGKDKILILEWDAQSKEEAITDAQNIEIINDTKKAEYPLVLLEHDEPAENQKNANANLNWNKDTKKASIAVSFTNGEDFKNLWTVVMPKESTALLYDIEPLPALSSDTQISVSGENVTVNLSGTKLDKFNSLLFMAVKNSPKGLAGLAQNALRQNGLNLEDSQEAQLVYRTEDLTNTQISFTLPDTLESGDYKLRVMAEDTDGNYYSEIEKEFSYTNKNQPKEPVIADIKNAGDYKAAVTFAEDGEEFDGYLFTAYDKDGNPVKGLSQLLYYKDGTSVKYDDDGKIAEYSGAKTASEFTIGGHYEYNPKQAEDGVVMGFSAGEYTIEAKKWKRILNGEKILTSKGAARNIVITKPTPTIITVSADKEGKEITETIEKGNGQAESYERLVYKDSELTFTLKADQKITGKWSLDNVKSGEITDLTNTINLPFDSLRDGFHTLEFIGKNENGDAAALTHVFGVDTTGPRLLLSSPISGSFFSNENGALTIAGITDKDAVLGVYDLTKNSEIVSRLELTVHEENGSFATEIQLDKTIAKHKLRIWAEDRVGNVCEKEVEVISDALGSIKSLELYSKEKKITNQKIAAGGEYELSVRAVLSDDSVMELNDSTLIEWKQVSSEGEAALLELNGKAELSVPEDAEGIVTARFLVNDAGAYSASASFGASNDKRVSLDSADTIIKTDNGWYTGKEVTPEVSVWYKGTKLIEGQDYTVQFANNIAATKKAAPDMLMRAQLLAESEKPLAVVTGINGYKDSISKEFEIYYLPENDAEGNALYHISGIGGEYYTSEVSITPKDGYAILAGAAGEPVEDIRIKEDGKHTAVFCIKRISDGALTEEIRLNIAVDGTAPTGEIRLDPKSWNKFLENITFGRYKVKKNQVEIYGEDETSGIKNISYAVSEKAYGSISELAAANLEWENYTEDKKPEIETNKNQVIYAKLTDNAGNQTYISSEGILIDDTAPEISDIMIKDDISLKDTQADITFTLSEAGKFYYAVVPENGGTGDDFAPSFEELKGQNIAGAVTGSGSINEDMAEKPVTLTVKGLSAGTPYRLYIAAEDNTVELGTNTEAGNKSAVAESEPVTTKSVIPKITKLPEIKGVYGMKVCDMELVPGRAAVGENTVKGKFLVYSEEIPSVDSQKEYEAVFVPENDSYAAVSILVKPEIAPRDLTAPQIVVSEIQEKYVYNGAEHTPDVKVSDSGAKITAEDYEIEYQNNVNAGTAAVVIRGRHNYTGIRTLDFKIEKCKAEIQVEQGKENYQKTEGDADFKLEGIKTNSDGKLSYQSANEDVARVNQEGIVQVAGKGNAVIQVLVLESGNFEASKIVEIQIEVAEKKDTTPDETESSPEEIDTTLEEVNTTPEEIDTTPEEVNTTPEEIDTTPDEIQSNPQESSNTLEESTGQKKETSTTEKGKIDNGIQNTGDTAHVMRYMLILGCTGIFVAIVSCRRKKR